MKKATNLRLVRPTPTPTQMLSDTTEAYTVSVENFLPFAF